MPEPRVDEAIEAATMLSVGDGEPIPFASKKRNADFHELFPDIPKEELLVDGGLIGPLNDFLLY